jgi:predicted DNA binding CopG/RHH family protein
MDKESKLEEEILASFERGEWQPVLKNKSEIARFAAMASASLAKDKRVNIASLPEIWTTFKQRPQKKRFLIRR